MFCAAYNYGNEDSIYIMRRGIDDKTQSQHPSQGTQAGRQFDPAAQRAFAAHLHHMQQQQSQQSQLHLHGQLREILYNQQARVPIANQPQTQPHSKNFDMVSVPEGLQDKDARAHVQNVQAKAYESGHKLKGHAVIQVPPNHKAKHDLPRITVHSGRKTGLVHASFLGAQSPPRQQPHFTATTSSAHTHFSTTANLLERVSGQSQSQPHITQHAGDKRRREGSDHVDTSLRLRKRAVKGERLV